MKTMGTVKSVCISRQRKSSGEQVHTARLTEQGIEGDIHFGTRKAPVTLLPYDRIRAYFEDRKEPVRYGRFGENMVVEGIDWSSLRKGDLFVIGDSGQQGDQVILQITRIDASNPAAESYSGFMVCTPMEPYFVFCRVLKGGILSAGKKIVTDKQTEGKQLERYGSISVEEAASRILEHVEKITETEQVSLADSVGRILAADMRSEINNPPFDRSPVDGYACRAEDTAGADREHPVQLRVIEEIDAGGYSDREILPGEAVRIMTGAAIPKGCNCCVYQEATDYGEDIVSVYKEHKPWDNYCYAGEDFKKGELLLEKDTKITYVEAAVLAGMGVDRVTVYRRPQVTVITTGDEVMEPGSALLPGKIYNSNQTLTVCRLLEWGIPAVRACSVKDDPESMAEAVRNALPDSDIIVTTGGVSVGKKDIMHETMRLLKGQRVFWGVQAKPGMPTLFSDCDGTPVLSFSGNPFGVLVTLEILLKPALFKMTEDPVLRTVRKRGILRQTLEKSVRGRRFVRARIENGEFFLPNGLHSNGVIGSMVGCNCLIDAGAEITAGCKKLEEGMEVEAILL